MDTPRRRLIVDIVTATSRITRIAAQASGNPTPVTVWRILSLLEAEGAQRIGEIASALRVTQPGITKLAATLEEQSLVTRSDDPDDARATVLAITHEGSQALGDWKVELGEALSPMFARLSDEDWNHLERAARILATIDGGDR